MEPLNTLITWAMLYLVIPVLDVQVWRKAPQRRGQSVLDNALADIGAWSVDALLATLVLALALRGPAIALEPPVITMLAVSIEVSLSFNFLQLHPRRRMSQTAARLVNHVIPPVPVCQ